ncbi:hypothetical protein [Bradyrhizobium sp. Ghvi]|uniref:hypothetical protein n=1 Tax=Bradyrhizobium sp. Ghvi TaxID=1855319 RepID=UPI001178A32E|nr:hypothetical protein [Bradyrhizobium sp. Ghvi]
MIEFQQSDTYPLGGLGGLLRQYFYFYLRSNDREPSPKPLNRGQLRLSRSRQEDRDLRCNCVDEFDYITNLARGLRERQNALIRALDFTHASTGIELTSGLAG